MEVRQCALRLLGPSGGDTKQQSQKQPTVGSGSPGYHLDRLQSSGRTRKYLPFFQNGFESGFRMPGYGHMVQE
jgi:hypothetical protein